MVTAVGAVLVAASASPFYLASGSEAGVDISTPSLAAKVFALAIMTAALAWALLGRRGHVAVRWILYTLSSVILGAATHAVVTNYKVGMIEEHWFFAKFDRAPFDVADGLSRDWQVTPSIFGVTLHHRSDARTIFVFTGPAPFRIDLGARFSEASLDRSATDTEQKR